MKLFSHAFVVVSVLCLSGLLLAGCSTDDNPVTPEKMQAIRKKQSDEMSQLAKGGEMPSKPPASTPAGGGSPR